MSEKTEIEIDDTKLPSELDDEDLFNLLKSWYINDMKANSPWYSEARTDFAFEAGDQISAEEEAQYKADERIHVSMNRIKPTVDVICGMEVTNRQEVQFIPRTTVAALPQVDPKTGQQIPQKPSDDDSEQTEGYTEVARWARDNCDAEDEESDSFRDTVICGMGWTSTEMDYDSDPEGKIVIDRLDPLEMGWDSTSTKRNLDDAKRFSRTKRDISAYDARESFPGKDLTDLHAGWAFEARLDEGYDHDRELARSYKNKNVDNEQRKSVTMVIMQWCEVHTAYETINPADGQAITIDKDQLKEAKKAAEMAGIQLTYREAKQKIWMQATLGSKLLKKEEAPCKHSSSFRCITGYRDRNKRQWYGIVRPMRDPQKWANKFFSVALEQIATSGKGLMAEIGSFVDDKKAEREWAKTGNIAWMKPGGMQRVMPKPQPPMLTGLADLMSLSLQSIRDVTGVNQETIGMADRDQAASLEYQRRQAGVTILAAFFDNLRRYRKEQGRVLLYFIKNYISDGRIIRILGETGPKFIQLIQTDDAQYDIIVDQAASSPNQKEAAWTVMQPILPIMLDKGAPPEVMLEILKASPLPTSAVSRIERAYKRSEEQKSQQGPSLQEQQMQADIQKTQAEAQGKQLDAQLKGQELQVRGMEAQANMQTTAMTLQDNAEKRRHDMEMRNMDMAQKKMDMGHEMGMKETETFGSNLPQIMESLTQGLMAMAQAIVQSNRETAQANAAVTSQAMAQQSADIQSVLATVAQGQQQLAQIMATPKTAILSPDGTSATVQMRMQ